MLKAKWTKTLVITIMVAVGLAFILPAQATKVMSGKDFVAECKPLIKSITVAEAKTLHDSGQWLFLDVRSEKEFKKGSIPNAVHLQRGLLEFQVQRKIPNKSAKVVVYCKSGGRSALSVCALKRMGYTQVVSMDGGWKGWIKEGHPVA